MTPQDELSTDYVLLIFLSLVVFCCPIMNCVYHNYVTKVNEMASESLKRFSERVSDSKLRLSAAGRKISDRKVSMRG